MNDEEPGKIIDNLITFFLVLYSTAILGYLVSWIIK